MALMQSSGVAAAAECPSIHLMVLRCRSGGGGRGHGTVLLLDDSRLSLDGAAGVAGPNRPPPSAPLRIVLLLVARVKGETRVGVTGAAR